MLDIILTEPARRMAETPEDEAVRDRVLSVAVANFGSS